MERTKLWLRVAIGGLVVAITVASGGVALGREQSGAPSFRMQPRCASSRLGPSCTPPALAPPALPVPTPPPGDALVPRVVHPVGRISLPTIGVEHEVYDGVTRPPSRPGPGTGPAPPSLEDGATPSSPVTA